MSSLQRLLSKLDFLQLVLNGNLQTTMFAKRFNGLLLGVTAIVTECSFSPLSNA